ncbi:MAG: hypothetical protein ACYC3N_07525 [Halothiobacillus sp.]
MHILVLLADEPVRSLPLWAAFTDAHNAIPGLKISVLGSEDMIACIKVHPAVTGSLVLDAHGLNQPGWLPKGWRARRSLKDAYAGFSPLPSLLLDPFGTRVGRVVACSMPGRRVGVANMRDAQSDRDYSSVFPLPSSLHPLQALRVFFAAALGYSLHDLVPNYGLVNVGGFSQPKRLVEANQQAMNEPIDLVVDWEAMTWDVAQCQQFRALLAMTDLRVAYLDESASTSAAKRLRLHWSQIATANYVLTGLNATAWLAAALGRPGVCLCPEGKAVAEGVVSTRWALNKMVNIDQSPFNQPHVAAQSIIRVLERQRINLLNNKA